MQNAFFLLCFVLFYFVLFLLFCFSFVLFIFFFHAIIAKVHFQVNIHIVTQILVPNLYQIYLFVCAKFWYKFSVVISCEINMILHTCQTVKILSGLSRFSTFKIEKNLCEKIRYWKIFTVYFEKQFLTFSTRTSILSMKEAFP